MNLDEEVESILYICREISVFKIPPLKANEGHQAADWGDLNQPLWKGRLRIIEKSTGVSLLFEDANTGELFAKSDYDPKKPPIDAVLDSSRYFAVRVEDSGRKAYIGMGFQERTESFDFNVALQDYTKRWKAAQEPPSTEVPEEETASPHVPAGPKKDYSLKEGQTFSISIPGRSKPSQRPNLLDSSGTTQPAASGGGAFPLLPPPPSSTKKRT